MQGADTSKIYVEERRLLAKETLRSAGKLTEELLHEIKNPSLLHAATIKLLHNLFIVLATKERSKFAS